MSDTITVRPHTPLRQYLFDLTLHGIKLGLDNIQALLRAAGNPQGAYPTVHVGGTNGKGSVVAMLAAILESAGYRVGRFTSPHLIDVSERFLVNGAPIPEDALEDNIRFFQRAAGDMPQCPTFFEMNTAIAFRYFAQARVDVALIEVGMGGRFDSTNVITPLVSAITNIDLEHTAFLGDTIEAIAGEKAGIIKAGVPVITTETRPEALKVFAQQAERKDAPLRRVGRDFHFEVAGTPWQQRFSYTGEGLNLEDVPLSLAGRYQGANAAAAATLAEELMVRFDALTPAHVASGLAEARWPCRVERVLDTPPVYIDVAHNVAGAEKLAALFERCVVIFAASSDKDVGGMLAALRPIADRLLLTAFAGKRATPVETLAKHVPPGEGEIVADLAEAIRQGLEQAVPECPLLITGSIYTAGEARQVLMDRFGGKPLRF
jgi:dihydrofolate synthase/folylpolyglutamate synthase